MDTALQHITEIVRQAAANRTPLRIRGGGSKDFYGQTLQGDVLDTRPLQGIVSYEPSELVITVRAGTPLAEVEEVLAERGQILPFEPPHFAASGAMATVGGMVASGLNGPARASVGAVRDYVLGLELLNGKAELLTFGGQVMKNVAGYDVSRLMAGAMGTLGLITEVSLKVLPRAVAESTLVFELDETRALAQLNSWGALPLPVNASCWFEGALMVRLRGAQAAVAAAQKSMGGTVMDAGQATLLWNALREQTAPFFQLAEGESLMRLSVPDTAPPLGLGPTLIEWGGAQRWLKLPLPRRPDMSEVLDSTAGHATLFRATDKSAGVFTPLAAPLDRITRELKKQFDPAGIFNRGRLYPDF
ncbi:glycolate oxidase subunit GlcE [Rhodoferax sp. BAB1]|uniref:glycolate oxidase subunit GlcE n=1 Tax=Rhodoferax sp. BAB1 TaxID=2741720 RepID=UPI0015763877|nr:glycolate oxidase subunit GlcE [Rhodoferax sp. BAB1]QKO23280.1 glycolate oxidase subunit GlcE [Rhodoferax sp. BAB1]